ncbi:helix-turn-helix domain-containing protein [Microbacterium sp. BK668]|uniref:helix-turn-helix domain-containing protein n=1 Tax=Microbacterium sp. BK668 TaxID=2512118 RepID=UPI00105D5C2E|nr:helix-turn-helix domain-containing protein [Microbacterium sp. BK668]
MTAPHAHNDIEVNFCAAPVTYESAGGSYTVPGGVPAAFWGSRPHQLVDISESEPHAFVTIPLARFMSWAVPAPATRRLLQGFILVGPDDEPWEGLPSAFDRWARDLFERREVPMRATALEVEALLLRMILGEWAATTTDRARSTLDLQRAAAMATYLAENLTTDVRVKDVATAVHLSPNRAAAIFRRIFGIGILRYLAQLRVSEAQRLLLTSDLTSEAVGARAGFGSASSFHETFLGECGTSPLRWREAHRNPAGPAPVG